MLVRTIDIHQGGMRYEVCNFRGDTEREKNSSFTTMARRLLEHPFSEFSSCTAASMPCVIILLETTAYWILPLAKLANGFTKTFHSYIGSSGCLFPYSASLSDDFNMDNIHRVMDPCGDLSTPGSGEKKPRTVSFLLHTCCIRYFSGSRIYELHVLVSVD